MNLNTFLNNPKYIKVKNIKQINQYGESVNLAVAKYKRNVFFDNLWDSYPETKKARGSVFDAVTGRQIVFPMDKCFNYLENGAGIALRDDQEVSIFKKLNGFMVNLTYNSLYGWIVSTTGDAVILGNETTNKYLAWACEAITDDVKARYHAIASKSSKWLGRSYTLTYELCHPEDPHIVDEEFGLHLLCLQAEGDVHVPLDGMKVNMQKMAFVQLKELLANVQHEGFMVYSGDRLLFKMKSPYYLAKKWIQRRNGDLLWSPLYKERMDEEYYPIVQRIREAYSKDYWDGLTETEKSGIFLWAYKDIFMGEKPK